MDQFIKRGYNPKSVISLVLGILSLVIPFFGLLLGMVAVVVANSVLRNNNAGYGADNGLAMAGKICGVLTTLFYALLLLYYVLYF
ncbi:hypothetical protein [Paenibacillus tuaregi]|uniref:hypothetical protein n=1 Tax=Paenibacillus tuaregi TaxID=1816681 RepID=UPI000837E3D9|nr:hypothetical protein [Paenibacillus tuaregi]